MIPFVSRNLLPLIVGLLFGTQTVWGQSFSWPEGKKMALSLSFDDARLSNVDVGVPLFKELGAQVTFYVNPGPMESRIEGWKQAVADGHEIGNHSDLHPCSGNFPWARSKALDSYSLSSMREELLQANQKIEDMLGVAPTSFAYPCGQKYVGRGTETQSYVPLIADLFESGRGWMNEAANDPLYVDFAQLQGIEMDGKDFEPHIRPILEAAKAAGTWVVLAGHEIGEGGPQTTKTSMLRELIAYAKNPGNGIWIAPVGTVGQHVQQQRMKVQENLSEALTLAASFDVDYKADYAVGDPVLYSAPSYGELEKASVGVDHPNRFFSAQSGKFGNSLWFKQKEGPVLFFQAEKNANYSSTNWEGTISLWLSLDPEEDLEPGYTDPIQITDVSYEDAALWVDFSDKNPRDFRMGVYGDKAVWNPQSLGPDENPAFYERLLKATLRPFAHGTWTHVAISFSGLNSGSGTASFYINGVHQGDREIPEPFTWEAEKAKVFLGLNYVGYIDEVALFSKALSSQEVQALYVLPEGVHQLIK